MCTNVTKKIGCAMVFGLLVTSGGMMGKMAQTKMARPVTRKPGYKVADCIVDRWSPRAMSGQSITHDELMSLFEAARWAPSSYNTQPWRFLFAHRDTKHWNTFFNLLVDFNKEWAKEGSALIVVISRKVSENGDSLPYHTLDTGAAWQNLALQASMNGLVAHGMAGFDTERARKELHIPEEYSIEMMIAIGRPGDKEKLPQYMQDMEVPSMRKNVEELVCEGPFSQ